MPETEAWIPDTPCRREDKDTKTENLWEGKLKRRAHY